MGKIWAVVVALLLTAGLCGCWDYKGLDELSLVAGIALDRSEVIEGGFRVSCEIVDATASIQSSQSQTKVIETDGSTIYEALYQANKRLLGMLYLGNTELLVISEELAREEGIDSLLEGFMRDPDIRDEIVVVVSRAESAAKLIAPQKDSMIVSYEMVRNLMQKDIATSNTKTMRLYQINNALKRDTDSVVLPAYNFKDVGEMEMPVLDGLAVFDGSNLGCYIEEGQVPYYMYLTGRPEGTAFVFRLGEGEEAPNLSANVRTCKQNKSYHLQGENLTAHFTVELQTQLYRIGMDVGPMTNQTMAALAERTGQAAKLELEGLIRAMQEGPGLDPFGIGTMIYRKDPSQWGLIKENWEDIFRRADISVDVKIDMIDAGWMVSY